jgi:hypothetical protein
MRTSAGYFVPHFSARKERSYSGIRDRMRAILITSNVA